MPGRGSAPAPPSQLLEFVRCAYSLKNEAGGEKLVVTLMGYLQRALAHPRRKEARRICQWDPEYKAFRSGSPMSLDCLLAAGFSVKETDANGTPYLVLSGVSVPVLRQYVEVCKRLLMSGDGVEAEAAGRKQEQPSALASARRESPAGVGRRAASPRRVVGAPGKRPSDARDADAERPMIETLQEMISGLISELERHASASNETSSSPPPNATDDGRKPQEPPSRAPVHYRVYRSPAFPGLPGMGLPFMGGGGDGDEEGEVAALERRLRSAALPAEADEVATRELKRLRRMSPMHSEYSTLIDYLEWIADLPWNKSTPERLSVAAARAQLDDDHYAMSKVKGRILESLAVCQLRGDTKGSIMCMLGPPGIGKTSLGKSIAAALGRDFYRVSLGGVHSEAEVRGHRRTYVGALPGLILQAMKKCGSNNAVIMLDEIDKLGRNSLNGDPSSALLEVLDPEQNQAFRDHFLALPFNLSRVLFIATANEIEGIPRPLRDRMELIEMHGYTVEEKIQIARRHLLKKQQEVHGLPPGTLTVSDEILDTLISGYTREAGVRELERQIAALCRSAAAKLIAQREGADETTDTADDHHAPANAPAANSAANLGPAMSPMSIGYDELVEALGPPKFDAERDVVARLQKPGTALGLAWMPFGGEVLFVEAEVMRGKGQVQLTGQLGDVMQESAKAALSWIRAHAAELHLSLLDDEESLLSKRDVHIHFPAGAISKDGPSAGVTITTALVSALTGRLVRADTAMTGEVTLRGVVLPVGGVKEKVIAAHRTGVRRIILPEQNKKDLREMPQTVKDEVTFIFASNVRQVLDAALMPESGTQPEPSTADGPEPTGLEDSHPHQPATI